MEFEQIKLETHGRVAVLTLNRPDKMNAWTATISHEASEAMYECDANDDIRAVIVTGAGRAFCAGADLGGDDLEGGDGGFAPKKVESTRPPMWPYMIRKPVIAAINGAAVGVGITFPLLADVRFVADDAKIGFVMARRGILPELGSHLVASHVLGMETAADLLLSGRIITGKEAVEIGLAKACMPKDKVLETAMEYANDIAVNTAPVSVALAKKLLWEAIADRIPGMMAAEGRIIKWMSGTPDATEGVKAFFEKRTPEWKLSPTNDIPQELFEI